MNIIRYIFAIIFITSVYSQPFYVDNAASGANDGSSWANAWESFADISWGSVSAGDTIFVSGGSSGKTYTNALNVGAAGASGNLIVITRGLDAGHNGAPLISTGSTTCMTFSGSGDKFVQVKSINFQSGNSSRGCINIDNADGVEVRNCNFTLEAAGRAAVHIQEASLVTVDACSVSTSSSNTGQHDGIYSQRSGRCTFTNNHIVISATNTGTHSDGIQSFTDTSIVIAYNYIEQNNSKTTNSQGIYATNCFGPDWEIYNNIVNAPNTHNSLITFYIVTEGNGHVKVVNNSNYGGRFGTMHVNGAGSTSEIKNNIMVFTGTNGNGLKLLNNSFAASNVDYNIYYSTVGSSFVGENSTGSKSWSAWRSIGYEANGKNSDPEYNSPGGDDFTLQSGSPAIDAGVDVSSILTDDYDGNERPQGSGWDMGAYEFGSTPPPPPVNASKWYVDIDVVSSGDGLSWATAYKNATDIVWAVVDPGDIVYFSDGTYATILAVGSDGKSHPDSMITIRDAIDAGHLGDVNFTGSGDDSPIQLSGDDYIKLLNLNVTDGRIDINNCVGDSIVNCEAFADVQGGIRIQNSDTITVINPVITTIASSATQTDGIFSSGNSQLKIDGADIRITNGSGTPRGIYCENDTSTQIINSFIYQNNAQTGVRAIDFNGVFGDSNVVANSILYAPNSTNRVLICEADQATDPDPTFYIYNNTIWGISGSGSAALNVEYSSGAKVKNNILVATGVNAVTWRITGGLQATSDVDYNLHFPLLSTDHIHDNGVLKSWATWTGTDGYEANGDTALSTTTLGIPNHASLDFHLTAASKAIDAGVALSALYSADFDGETRPMGGGWDQGALEFLSGGDRSAWYVNDNATGLNNGFSREDAWEGILQINWASVGPGDTVYFSGGVTSNTYSDSMDISGTDGKADSLIVVMPDTHPDHAGRVILAGPQDSTFHAIQISGVDFIKIDNLETNRGMIEVQNSDSVTISNCIIDSWFIGISSSTGNGKLVIEDNTMTVRGNAAIGGPACIYNATSADTLFIHRNSMFMVNANQTSRGIWNPSADKHLDIQRNFFRSSFTTSTEDQYFIQSLTNADPIVIANNVFADTLDVIDTLIVLTGTAGSTDNVKIYGNTFYNGKIPVSLKAHNSLDVKNNIFFTEGTLDYGPFLFANPSAGEFDYNLYYNTAGSNTIAIISGNNKTWNGWKTLGQEASGLNANPFFDTGDNLSYTLSDSSFAIDAGVDLGPEFAIDVDGTTRPKFSGWDIGAYEALLKTAPPDIEIIRRKYKSYSKYKGW